MSVRRIEGMLREPYRGRLVRPHNVLPSLTAALAAIRDLVGAVGEYLDSSEWREAYDGLDRSLAELKKPTASELALRESVHAYEARVCANTGLEQWPLVKRPLRGHKLKPMVSIVPRRLLTSGDRPRAGVTYSKVVEDDELRRGAAAQRRSDATKRRHTARRDRGECIYDPTDNGGKAHGPPFKGGRCQVCWDAKLESEARNTESTEQTILSSRYSDSG